jgi:hypothetical protein
MRIDARLRPAELAPALDRLWAVSAAKIRAIERRYDPTQGAPVFTAGGRYTSRGWTDWTEGFQYGSALLQFDATGDRRFLEIGRRHTIERMAPHLTHTGVHDHGFNNVSTYGALWRLAREGRIGATPWERRYYELALKCSGAVQASRWTSLGADTGFIHSFNGPHSLFVDTIRSLRSLAIAHRLGHVLVEEGDRRVSLLARLVAHARATATYLVVTEPGRDVYALRGRVTHEGVFNTKSGAFRCLSTQQGYSPFSTWTRGQAWAICGFAEELEFLATVPAADLAPHGGVRAVSAFMLDAARTAADHYIAHSALDGIPYWDVGAPGLPALGDITARPADPWNGVEPVDSSAAAIAAQGLLRLGHYLGAERGAGRKYWQAGLTVARTLFSDAYVSLKRGHEGLLLHAVYHRPNGWDAVPPGREIPCGESCMWGDYHLRELALYLQRVIRCDPYLTFWGPGDGSR